MIEKFEKEVSSFFDECAAEGIFDTFPAEEKTKINVLLERWNIKTGQRILEPGCGSGRLTELLSHAVGADGEVFACDLSGEMIRIANKRGLPGNIIFFHGSVNSVPRDDCFFDKVICFQVFPHFLDHKRSLAEIARLLKPGGELWLNHLKIRVDINNLHKNASSVVISHQIPSSKEMRLLLTEAGFEVMEIEEDTPHGYSAHALKKQISGL